MSFLKMAWASLTSESIVNSSINAIKGLTDKKSLSTYFFKMPQGKLTAEGTISNSIAIIMIKF